MQHFDQFSWRAIYWQLVMYPSTRSHSFFSNSHLFPRDICHFLFIHIEGQAVYKCAEMCGISYKSTAVEWGEKKQIKNVKNVE